VPGTSVLFDMETGCWENGSVSCSADDLLRENNSTTATTTISDHILAASYWMIFVAGVTGNLLVLAVVIWKSVKSPQSDAMTIFVGSLAVADLGLLLWVTWVNALISLHPEWTFGKLTCQMYTVWRSLTANCSMATLMFISVDRYALYQILAYLHANNCIPAVTADGCSFCCRHKPQARLFIVVPILYAIHSRIVAYYVRFRTIGKGRI